MRLSSESATSASPLNTETQASGKEFSLRFPTGESQLEIQRCAGKKPKQEQQLPLRDDPPPPHRTKSHRTIRWSSKRRRRSRDRARDSCGESSTPPRRRRGGAAGRREAPMPIGGGRREISCSVRPIPRNQRHHRKLDKPTRKCVIIDHRSLAILLDCRLTCLPRSRSRRDDFPSTSKKLKTN